MLYYLYETFNINIFSYITFRAGFAFFVSFVLTITFIPLFIKWAKSKNAMQPIYNFAPLAHKKKQNTPTMGGLIFMTSSLIAICMSADLNNNFVLIAIACLVSFGLIGFYDDIRKIISNTNEDGLKAYVKFALQIIFAGLISSLLFVSQFPTDLYLPFLKSPVIDMHWVAIIFWTIVIVASSNATNLTDGLDGLATVPSILGFLSLAVFMYISGHAILAQGLLMPRIIGVGEISVISAALIGGLIGFLWYNANPAQVFMGDSGSLPLGAMLGLFGIFAKSEILLLLIGSIFVIEALSVIIQVAGYKTIGKRFFLMAPIHHHFELKNWAENKIIVRFWIIALLSNLIALSTIKIR